MPKTINLEYTKPTTGEQAAARVTIDVDTYRPDGVEPAVESYFLKGSAAGASVIYELADDLVADLLDGKPSGVKAGVVQSYIDAPFTANGTTLSVTPEANTAGFEAEIPCVVMDKYGNVIDWFIPSIVGGDFTVPDTGLAALGENCAVGWIVQQAKPFASPLGQNSQLGIKAQLERPTTPTGVNGEDTGEKITCAWTKPSDLVIQYYDIYCIKAATQPNAIEPNSIPSVADRAAALASTGVDVENYFDESDMTLKPIDAGDYFVGVVAKDGSGRYKVNESAIGWSAKITVEELIS